MVRGDVKLSFRNLAEVKAMADQAVAGHRGRFVLLRGALHFLGIPPAMHATIISRWKAAGGTPLADFAPYTHYLLTVEVFFHLAIASALIGTDRAYNRVDIAYLYYLPFCMIFTSGDKLTRKRHRCS